MKKLFLIPLMALLCSVSTWAVNVAKIERTGTEYASVEAAFEAAQTNDVITLLRDAETSATIWIGTINADPTLANSTPRSLTLDFAGHNLSSDDGVVKTFLLSHGALKLVNSGATGGQLKNTYNGGKSGIAIETYGTYMKNCGDPSKDGDAEWFSYLSIGTGVTVTVNEFNGESNALVVDYLNTQLSSYGVAYKTKFDGSSYGLANGVRIDIRGNVDAQKYGIKVNGNVSYETKYKYNGDQVLESDKVYSPFIHIYPTAKMTSADNAAKATAVYASGYARWLIEGTCEAATGVYIKSGAVELKDATITSTWTSTAIDITTGKNSGISAGGSGVIIESNSSYAGEQILVVDGNTNISSQADGGAALTELVDLKQGKTKVDSIVIRSGTFAADNAIMISTETFEEVEAEVIVYGSNVEGDVTVANETNTSEALNMILAEEAFVAEIVDPESGNTTLVVNNDGTPPALTSWNDVLNLTSGSSADWQKAEEGILGDGSTAKKLTLKLFQMNAGSEGHLQTLRIKKNATLEAKRIVMNHYARIIVEPGGRLIVNGEQGLYSPNTDNITLQTNATDQAVLLISPNTISGQHPKGTVEFRTKSFYASASNYAFERFGIPTYNTPESFTCPSDVRTRIWEFSEATDSWSEISSGKWTAEDADKGKSNFQPSDVSKLNKPFAGYNLMAYTASAGSVYKMKGALQGNGNAELHAIQRWTSFANSYTADMDIAELLKCIPNTMTKAVYLARPNGNTYTWEAFTELTMALGLYPETKIVPMRAFLLNNQTAMSKWVVANYKNTVWTPASAAAPARQRASYNDKTTANIVVVNENGDLDHVVLAESNDFSAEYENIRDAEKYMNEDVNIYAHAEVNQCVLATDNLEDTYLGFSTVNGGNFTISFKNVEGRDLDLIDLQENATIAIVEGNTYNFTAEANTNADYRFKVVERKKVHTGVDNLNADNSAKGVYTIMGQYVGEMNIWNTLPAGVYVVNGEKRVK